MRDDYLWLEGEDVGEGSLGCGASRGVIIVIMIGDISNWLVVWLIILLHRLMNRPFRELDVVMQTESGVNLIVLFLLKRKSLMPWLRLRPRRKVSRSPRRVHQAVKLIGLPVCAIVSLVNVRQRHVLCGVELLLVLVVVQCHIVMVRLQRGLAALVDLFLLLLDLSLDTIDIFFLMLLSVLAVHKKGDAADDHSHSKEDTDDDRQG